MHRPLDSLFGSLQTHARKNELPLDELTFITNVTTIMSPEQVTSPPPDGCYVHGLVLEVKLTEI